MYSKRLTFHYFHPMSMTHLLLCMDLPLVVRRCLVRPLLTIHFPWFVDWSSCVHRSVASEDEMTQHCDAGTQNSRVSHHITSHHITSHHITSHHITSQHFVGFVAKCVHEVTKLHFVSTLERKRHIFAVKLKDTREPRSANMPARLCDNLPNDFDTFIT